ncbi:MAG: WD40 repeat domain-containing protein [Okeania sp. SIO2F4]|nr:WD40 repeat domain-containing protein [Okeania sp. SIO2F4]
MRISRADGNQIELLKPHPGELKQNQVLAVSFSPESQIFVIGDITGKIEIRKRDGSLQNTIEAHKLPVLGLSFSPDGKVFASGSGDGTAKLWNINGSLERILLDNDNNNSKLRVFGVAFSPDKDPDKQIIAVTINNNKVKLLNRDGKQLKVLKGHKRLVRAVAFSRDGKLIATASDDQTVKLWDTNGKERGTFYGHNDRVIGLAFSPDGNRIASASDDKTVLLWDVNIKQELPELREYTCNWMQNYLKNNPNIDDSDRQLCNSQNKLKTYYRKFRQKFKEIHRQMDVGLSPE